MAGAWSNTGVDAIVSSEQRILSSVAILAPLAGKSGVGTALLYRASSMRPQKATYFAPGRFLTRPGLRTSPESSMPAFTTPAIGPAWKMDLGKQITLEAVGSCIAQVLDAAVAQNLKSVAFPLIGGGLFGLDEKLLVLQFLDLIEAFDKRLAEGEHLEVWLVIRDRAQFESAADKFIDLLMEARKGMVMLEIEQTGVLILDRFAICRLYRSADGRQGRLCML
jgi:O-acetyl-ADP-ribose deacetylase (regulator of RNase III)